MYLDEIISEFPEQFKNQKNIKVIVKAFSRQLDELKVVFNDLEQKRSLERATGRQLDGVGDIVVLSRREAGLLAGVQITFPVIDDDRYRKYLKYKVLKNTSSCTYYDIINGFTMLYGSAVEPIYYSEDPDLPATIILEIPMLKPDGVASTLGDIPAIKAGGVGIKFLYKIFSGIEIRSIVTFCECDFKMCGEHRCGTLPWQYQVGRMVKAFIEASTHVSAVLNEPPLTGTLMAPGEKFQYQIGEVVKSDIELRASLVNSALNLNQTGTLSAGGGSLQYQIGELVRREVFTTTNAEFAVTELTESGTAKCGDGCTSGCLIETNAKAECFVLHAFTEPLICGREACGIDFAGKDGE